MSQSRCSEVKGAFSGMKGIGFISMAEKLHEQDDDDGEKDEKAGLVEEQRMALEQARFVLEERLDAGGVFEIEGELGIMAVAPFRIDRDGPQEQAFQPGWQIRVEFRGGFRRVKMRRLEALDFTIGKSAREGLVNRDSEGEDFRALGDRRVVKTLRREITGRARPRGNRKDFRGAAEIDELEAQPIVVADDENVFRFEIAVDEVEPQQMRAASTKKRPSATASSTESSRERSNMWRLGASTNSMT